MLGEAKKARIQAETEAQKAINNLKLAREAVQKYYTQVANDARLKPHNLETLRRDLLQSANEYYENLTSQDSDDPDLQAERARAFLAGTSNALWAIGLLLKLLISKHLRLLRGLHRNSAPRPHIKVHSLQL